MESGGQVEVQVRSIGGARRYLNSRSPCRRFISGSSLSARLKIGPLAGGTLLLVESVKSAHRARLLESRCWHAARDACACATTQRRESGNCTACYNILPVQLKFQVLQAKWKGLENNVDGCFGRRDLQ